MPGQPPANVEYSRRNSAAPFRTSTSVSFYGPDRNPQKDLDRDSLGRMFWGQDGQDSKIDDASLQADHCGVCSIVGAQLGKD